MMDLMRFKKISLINERDEENSGAIHPRKIPKTNPNKICLVNEICHQGFVSCCICMEKFH